MDHGLDADDRLWGKKKGLEEGFCYFCDLEEGIWKEETGTARKIGEGRNKTGVDPSNKEANGNNDHLLVGNEIISLKKGCIIIYLVWENSRF
ncbi:hypothetical protein HanIR_Chr08g0387071 [Helianthus annuus]|nr:hypothetical protein HanIR_Chr08g0387071 [Helianthus annuus]